MIVYCILGLLAATCCLAGEIDNKLLGNPIVDCQKHSKNQNHVDLPVPGYIKMSVRTVANDAVDTMVSLTFNTEKPFSGRIYVKGLADDNRCSRNFATNSDQNQFSMMIGQGDCNMGRQRVFGQGEPIEGLVFSLVIVVSFHGTFVTKSDRAFRCMCFFRNIKRVTNFIDMSMIGTTELLDTVKTPTCVYEIRSGSPSGPLVRYSKIGDVMFHTWSCDDPEQGFLVHSCWVNDGRGNRFDLLDIDGCAIDPIIQPDIEYDADLTLASVETHGYKFSDTSVLDYMCVVELCKKAAGECNGLVPPQCGRGKRRRRNTILAESNKPFRADLGNRNEMDVISTLQVLDTLDDDASFSGPDNDFLRRLNTPLGGYRLSGQTTLVEPSSGTGVCLSYPAFGIMITLTVLLFVICASASFIVCSRTSSKVLPSLH